jgi:pimeloyl-ACP methyl ester carboxylesterase
MRLETVFHRGDRNKPLIILIHGMGMNARIWSEPSSVKVLAGTYPLSALLDEKYRDLQTLFADFTERGFSILSWSQSRPVGPLHVAVEELRVLIGAHRDYAGHGMILIGHSRGGLIGRKYIEGTPDAVMGLITISTPHLGTTLARWSMYLCPIASFLGKVSGLAREGEINKTIKKIEGFLNSEGLREMLPDSPLYAGFMDRKQGDIRYLSIGGTNPDLIKIKNISIFELFSKVMPEKSAPEEIRTGFGDGLVSSSSSVLPSGDEHRNFHLNHVSVLFDREVREYVLDRVEGIS